MESNKQITKSIQNLIGVCEIFPDVKHIWLSIFENGIDCGYFDEDNVQISAYQIGSWNQFETRISEVFSVTGFLRLVDELGREHLIEYLDNKYSELLIENRKNELSE